MTRPEPADREIIKTLHCRQNGGVHKWASTSNGDTEVCEVCNTERRTTVYCPQCKGKTDKLISLTAPYDILWAGCFDCWMQIVPKIEAALNSAA